MLVRVKDGAILSHGQSQVFDFPRKSGMKQGFVICFEKEFFAYLNECQHWPVPLDMGDADFFHPGLERITCKTHGAVYHPKTGYCEYGPCSRSQLTSYQVTQEGQDLLVLIPEKVE